ncbi:MAG: hypothetical protein NUV57_01070 [archaeon]|nr:hypothetical protein [archaeon]
MKSHKVPERPLLPKIGVHTRADVLGIISQPNFRSMNLPQKLNILERIRQNASNAEVQNLVMHLSNRIKENPEKKVGSVTLVTPNSLTQLNKLMKASAFTSLSIREKQEIIEKWLGEIPDESMQKMLIAQYGQYEKVSYAQWAKQKVNKLGLTLPEAKGLPVKTKQQVDELLEAEFLKSARRKITDPLLLEIDLLERMLPHAGSGEIINYINSKIRKRLAIKSN